MGCGMMRSPEKILIFLLSALAVLSLWVCGIALADVYDDFSRSGIDTDKWTLSGTPGLFTQSEGRLRFFGKKNAAQTLESTITFEPGFFRIEFYDFYSSNDALPGRGIGSYLALGLGPRVNYVRVLRGRVRSGGYFEANHFTDNNLQLWHLPTAVGFGQLGLYYDGSTVSLFYNIGLDANKGWQMVGPRITPGWDSSPKLFISGYPGADGRTRFAVDNVEYVPAPLPSTLLKRLK